MEFPPALCCLMHPAWPCDGLPGAHVTSDSPGLKRCSLATVCFRPGAFDPQFRVFFGGQSRSAIEPPELPSPIASRKGFGPALRFSTFAMGCKDARHICQAIVPPLSQIPGSRRQIFDRWRKSPTLSLARAKAQNMLFARRSAANPAGNGSQRMASRNIFVQLRFLPMGQSCKGYYWMAAQ